MHSLPNGFDVFAIDYVYGNNEIFINFDAKSANVHISFSFHSKGNVNV